MLHPKLRRKRKIYWNSVSYRSVKQKEQRRRGYSAHWKSIAVNPSSSIEVQILNGWSFLEWFSFFSIFRSFLCSLARRLAYTFNGVLCSSSSYSTYCRIIFNARYIYPFLHHTRVRATMLLRSFIIRFWPQKQFISQHWRFFPSYNIHLYTFCGPLSQTHIRIREKKERQRDGDPTCIIILFYLFNFYRHFGHTTSRTIYHLSVDDVIHTCAVSWCNVRVVASELVKARKRKKDTLEAIEKANAPGNTMVVQLKIIKSQCSQKL